jgi:hypothetical protein
MNETLVQGLWMVFFLALGLLLGLVVQKLARLL